MASICNQTMLSSHTSTSGAELSRRVCWIGKCFSDRYTPSSRLPDRVSKTSVASVASMRGYVEQLYCLGDRMYRERIYIAVNKTCIIAPPTLCGFEALKSGSS